MLKYRVCLIKMAVKHIYVWMMKTFIISFRGHTGKEMEDV